MSDDIASRVRSSVKVTFAATILSGIVQALAMVVLARLLTPSDYGYYALALSIGAVTVGLLAGSIERAVVIQSEDESLRGRAIPITLLAFIFSILTVAICAAVAHLTGWKVRIDILAIICVTQGFSSIAIVPRAILRRNFRFRRLAAGDLCATIFGNGLTTLIMVRMDLGPYALAGGYVAANLIGTATALWAPMPGTFSIDVGRSGKLVRTVIGIIKIAGIEAAHGQISPLALSAVLGPVALGLFNRVYTLITLPIQMLTSSMGRVMVSGLVAVADDPARLLRSSGILIRVAAALMTPLALGMAGASNEFTLAVLGPKWTAAAPIVPFLAVTVWCNMIGSLFAVLAEAVQRLRAKFWIQVLSTGALVAFVLTGSLWGLVGVVVGTMAASVLFIAMYLALCCRILSVRVARVLGWLAPGWAAGLGCFAAARALHLLVASVGTDLLLLLQILACGAIAGICFLIFDRPLIREMSRAILPSRVDRSVQMLLTPRGFSA